MALFSCYTGLARQDLLFRSSDSMGTTMKMAFVIYSKTFSAIQRSDQKVIECFNSYCGLARQDLLFNE
jgi:hypothetical protein